MSEQIRLQELAQELDVSQTYLEELLTLGIGIEIIASLIEAAESLCSPLSPSTEIDPPVLAQAWAAAGDDVEIFSMIVNQATDLVGSPNDRLSDATWVYLTGSAGINRS